MHACVIFANFNWNSEQLKWCVIHMKEKLMLKPLLIMILDLLIEVTLYFIIAKFAFILLINSKVLVYFCAICCILFLFLHAIFLQILKILNKIQLLF